MKRPLRQSLRERAMQSCDGFLFRVSSMARTLWPFSANAGPPAYVASAVVVAFLWCLANAPLWLHTGNYHLATAPLRGISSGTVVTVAVGLTAIPLALIIMLGQMYKGHSGRLRVLLTKSLVQIALIVTVTTAIVSAALGGWFFGWLAFIYLSLAGILSCSSTFRVINLLLHPGEFVEQWGRFILSRQQRITSRSAFRQRKADAAAAAFAGCGGDIKIDQWFEHFHRVDLDKYGKVAAGRIGQIDDVDRAAVCQQLAILQTYARLQAGQSTSALTDTSATTDSSSTGMLDDHTGFPLIVITCAPESLIEDPDETVLLFRKDLAQSPWICRKIASSLRRAFRIDNSEHILEMAADLRSEATELRDELMRGIRSNNQTMVSDFKSVSLCVVGAAKHVMELQPSTASRRVYSDVLDVLIHSVNDARQLVEHRSTEFDKEVGALTLSLPRSLAYAGAETGSPDTFDHCLSPFFNQCRDALRRQPAAPETEDCLSSYRVLSSAILRMTEPNTEQKISVDGAISEARFLLQSLSVLLLTCAREEKWDAADLVAKEISGLEPGSSRRRRVLAITSAEYPDRFAILMYLMYFGVHACLVDLAMAQQPVSSQIGLLNATWPYLKADLSELLGVYAQATLDDSAAKWSWGWEPPHPLGEGFTPSTDDILAHGFVAIAITWPGFALFRESDGSWLAAQLEKLEGAAGGTSQLEHLLGKNSLVDRILNDGEMMQKLVNSTAGSLASAGALRRLLDYVQEILVSIERKKIREFEVPPGVITEFVAKLVSQYDANKEETAVLLETLGLLRSGPAPSDMTGSPALRGINTVIDKQPFISSQSDSRSHIAEEYGNELRQMQVGFALKQLSEYGTPTDIASILAQHSPLQTAKGVLLVDTDIEWLPSDLQALVERSGSARPDHNAPEAFLRVAGRRLPMYNIWVGGAVKPLMLFIEEPNSAYINRLPWYSEPGWTPSAKMDVKIRLQVPCQEDGAMDTLLKQDPAWLKEKAQTEDEKRAYLGELVWLQAYQQLAFCLGTTPGIYRLDLSTDEPDRPSQAKDESTG